MWEQLIKIIEINKLEFKNQLLTLVEQCLNYKYDNNCYIHGDLGIWNLLFNQSKVYIIDFGEARKGNNHFDISAVISSTIDWNQEENKIIAALTDFKNGYISNFDFFNWTALKENLTLWFTRGIIVLLVYQGINEQTINNIKETMVRKNKIDGILEKNFI